jgi:hypothetical protein
LGTEGPQTPIHASALCASLKKGENKMASKKIEYEPMDKRAEAEIVLDFPVQLADRVLDKVTMRRPKMKDMLKFDLDNVSIEESMKLVASLCGLVPDELEEMDSSDFDKLQKQLLRFRGVAARE